MRLRNVLLAAGLGLLTMVAEAQATKSDAELKVEAQQAADFYQKQNFVAALPLYEDLHKQQPQSLGYEERLAMSLLGASTQQSGNAAEATKLRAKNLLLDAKSKGDDSNLMQTLLEKLQQGEEAGPQAPVVGKEWFDKGEAAFSRGELETAVGFYAKALEVNPAYYAAALYAGDAEFKLGHPAEAGKWFAQAIAIDPDVETAHRYWGDSLEKAGEHQRAEEQFIEAVIGDPYSRSPRLGLKQWAEKNHAQLAPPPITLPKRAEVDAKGKTNIMIDPAMLGSPASSAWLMYSMTGPAWRSGEFAKHYPKEKEYRHSLAEEVAALRGVVTMAKEQKIPESKLDTSLKLVIELDKKGMLESYILLDDPDQGVAQDYVAYRKDHRAVMEKYMAEYDVHVM
jgi:tetratricopeptide (TPR) repeat protein